MQAIRHIEIYGARKHNLKDIDLRIPKRQIITITGVSGSGKSSLAYDTIFQEGQRKYLESLSIYARQFITSLEKPEVRIIRGISPTISIDQKHSSYYYNSTAGTVSEVSQYLRLLFARAAKARCPGCAKEISGASPGQAAERVFARFPDSLIHIFAPVVRGRKGNHKSLFEKYIKRGFLKALVDGTVSYLDEPDLPDLKATVPHDIAIQVDALKASPQHRKRLEESLGLAAFESGGEIIVRQGRQELFFSNKLYCPDCNISIKEPQPATFSLNSPAGACQTCGGRGEYGKSGDGCQSCGGSGYNSWALSFYFHEFNIFQLGQMEIADLLEFFQSLSLEGDEAVLLEAVIPQIVQRLQSFVKLNLGYISLNRKINTLSGGELQRTRLVSQIGFSLSGIIYILDEPSIGMHAGEQRHLLDILRELKEKDNTVILVEHDEQTIKASDYVIDLGPGAGEHGGHVIYSGWFKDFPKARSSLTSDYIFKRKEVEIKKPPVPASPGLAEVTGITINNLRNAHFKLPLQALTVVTGVSGSGKSSLIIDAFYPIARAALEEKRVQTKKLQYKEVSGLESIGRVMTVTQTAIGRNARSCPATYIGIMPMIRDLFAALTEAKIRGYAPARFSFNVSGGRCESCKGTGVKKLEMSFLPDLEVPCSVCKGKRYNSETLRVRYNGLSIADVLELTAREAYSLFQNIPMLAKKLKVLLDVGLSYLKLGQSSTTLSGGESQRIKLTKELSRLSRKKTIYLLDEPTIGLHFADIQYLLDVLFNLISQGHTVVVIEHNPELIKAADNIIEMGPGGGKHGGRII